MWIKYSNRTLKQKLSSLVAGTFGSLLPPALALALVISLAMPFPVKATPLMPFQIYGSATVDGRQAAGVQVTAKINGIQYASTQTDSTSRYGYSPVYFRIIADDPGTPAIEGGVDGDTINLYVAGILAGTAVFSSGSLSNQNLAVVSQSAPAAPVQAPPPAQPALAPTTAAVAQPTPAATLIPTLPPQPVVPTEEPLVTQPNPAAPAPVVAQNPVVTTQAVDLSRNTNGGDISSALSQNLVSKTTKPAASKAAASSGITLSYPVIGGIGAVLALALIVLAFIFGRRSKH